MAVATQKIDPVVVVDDVENLDAPWQVFGIGILALFQVAIRCHDPMVASQMVYDGHAFLDAPHELRTRLTGQPFRYLCASHAVF